MANHYIVGLATIIILTILSILYDSFNMDMYQCAAVQHPTSPAVISATRSFSSKPTGFDITGNDVMVLLHIQKTGGSSFGRHLVHDLELERPCECKRGVKACQCPRPGKDNEMWLFSEFSVGWSCGLHADWTEMMNCVPNMLDKFEGAVQHQHRRYFYMTVLRNPMARYLSEWQHVQRGATWKTAVHMCDGKVPTKEELPPCYQGLNWMDVSLQEFIDCRYNLANNRQTRMLADLSEVGCYNLSRLTDGERRAKLLESAKRNLKRLAFFGILEYQRETQLLFEDIFKLSFRKDFVQFDATKGTSMQDSLTDDELGQIREVNAEDFLLYDFAKKLFLERVAAVEQKRRKRTTLTKRERRKRPKH